MRERPDSRFASPRLTSRAEPPDRAAEPALAVIGLWHLGCTIAAAWLLLGRRIIAFDPSGSVEPGLHAGKIPVEEPGVLEPLTRGLATGQLRFSHEPTDLQECSVALITHDTRVGVDDAVDLTEIYASVDTIGQHAAAETTVVVCSQLRVGTARLLRTRLQHLNGTAELVYLPENLRLGEALDCYLRPDFLVVGSASGRAVESVDRLLEPIEAQKFYMNFESAEMVKHAVNSFLATSVSMANEWADICAIVNADYASVERVLRADSRIGQHAYVSPGIGFSGGTLGRDVRVLAEIARTHFTDRTSLFGSVLETNRDRSDGLTRRLVDYLSPGPSKVAILGMTYKAGTSTLRRSLPLAMARALTSRGIAVRVHDPGADWTEVDLNGIEIAPDPYAAASAADILLILTGWPEYRALDLSRMALALKRKEIIDPGGVLRSRSSELDRVGFRTSWSMAVPLDWKR
jgi:UDPglucose 6-dehydrogenase